jgi:hypothetical protein
MNVLLNRELCDLYGLPRIIRVQSRRLQWSRLVTLMEGNNKCVNNFGGETTWKTSRIM